MYDLCKKEFSVTKEQRYRRNYTYKPCVGCIWNCGQWLMRPSYDEPMLEGHCQKTDGNFTYMTDSYCPYSDKTNYDLKFRKALYTLKNTKLKSFEEELEQGLIDYKRK
jgi:hypothetical protein